MPWEAEDYGGGDYGDAKAVGMAARQRVRPRHPEQPPGWGARHLQGRGRQAPFTWTDTHANPALHRPDDEVDGGSCAAN